MSMGRTALEEKLKHLEMIQGVINRLASNSFRIKGWSVVLVTALLALASGDGSFEMVFVSCVPVLVFWGLDGYYVSRERLFRALYDCVRCGSATDFSMDIKRLKKPGCLGARDWCLAVRSATIWPFYVTLVVASVGLALVRMAGDGT